MQSQVTCISIEQIFVTSAGISRVAWTVACPVFIGLGTHGPIHTASFENITGNLYVHLVYVVNKSLKDSFLLTKGAAHIRLLQCKGVPIQTPSCLPQFDGLLIVLHVESCSRAIWFKQQLTHTIKLSYCIMPGAWLGPGESRCFLKIASVWEKLQHRTIS